MIEKILSGIVGIAMAIIGFFTAPSQVKKLQQDLIVANQKISVLESSNFGSTGFVSSRREKLAGSGIGVSDTTITLQEFEQPDNVTKLTMTDFGSIGYGTLEPGTSKKEFISFTGITQNGDGTAALTGVTRGLMFVSPYTASTSLRQTHSGGAIFIISNPPQLYNRGVFQDNPATITAQWLFNATSFPQYLSHPDFTGVTTTAFASLNYVNGVASSGAADLSFTVKGIGERATPAEIAAGTELGGTGAVLVIGADQANSSSSATTTVVTTDTAGKIDPNFINVTSNYSWTGTHTFASTTTGYNDFIFTAADTMNATSAVMISPISSGIATTGVLFATTTDTSVGFNGIVVDSVQTYTPSSTQRVLSISLRMKKTSSPTDNIQISVEPLGFKESIVAPANGSSLSSTTSIEYLSRTGVVLCNGTQDASALGTTYSDLAFTCANPFFMLAGEKYGVFIKRTNVGDTSNTIQLAGVATDAYGAGGFYVATSSATSSPIGQRWQNNTGAISEVNDVWVAFNNHTGNTAGQAFRAQVDGKLFSGFATGAVASGSSVTVRLGGKHTGFANLTSGYTYYLSTSTVGEISSTRGAITRSIGSAVNTTILNIDDGGPVIKP